MARIFFVDASMPDTLLYRMAFQGHLDCLACQDTALLELNENCFDQKDYIQELEIYSFELSSACKSLTVNAVE